MSLFRFAAVPLLLSVVCLLLAGSALAGDSGSETELYTFDFIYANANTGEAAGGHTAVRIGATVFHFQFFPQGRFLLVRDSWSHFRYVYNELRNRSLFVVRLSLAPRTYTRLKNHLTGLLIAQQRDLTRLLAAQARLQMVQQLAAHAGELELPAVGLFDRGSQDDSDMASLYRRIQQKLGSNFLGNIQDQLKAEVARMTAAPGEKDKGSWAAGLQEVLLEQEFIRIVQTGAPLNRDAVIVAQAGTAALSADELIALGRYRDELAVSVIGLFQSSRPDRARALLLQTARYLAVSRSLATARLHTLDPFSRRAVLVAAEQGEDLLGLSEQLAKDAARARHDFFQEERYPDIAYAILETAQGRLHEVEGAILTGRAVRVEQGILLPGRSGKVHLPQILRELPTLQDFVAVEQAAVTQLTRQLAERYGYDLIRRNCATELVRAVNSAFPDPDTGRMELGGWLEPDSDLLFIPNQLYKQVRERFFVQEERVLPSRRLRRLAALYEAGSDLPIWLQESNTLSSSLYTSRSVDTPFLFFTDDALWLRPVFGAANFCWAAVNGASGLLTLPVDGGERFYQGLRGMFYSFPELFFSNIRKGTYSFAEMDSPGP